MKHLTSKEMHAIADEMAMNIVLRDENTHEDIRKKSTKAQRQVLHGVFFSALSTRVWRSSSPHIEFEKQAILDMAEMCADMAIPNCNGYLTVYSPLKSLFSELEKESD